MRRVAVLTAWTAIALLGGCEQARTELVVRVDSEVAWGSGRAVQSVVLTVRRGGPTGLLRSVRTTALGQGREQLPMLVGVIESLDDMDTPVWIEALGCGDPNGCTAETAAVAQRAVVRFVAGQTLEVPLLLASACAGVACASDQRCATSSGHCEAATRAQETVRPFTGNVDQGGDDAAVEDVPADVGTIVDSSSDAGMVDLGTMDTAVEDTGSTDVARPEVGPVDAPMVDAGSAETGVVDAGPVDTGPRDAGVVDSGPVDTGPTDAGPSDTGATVPTIECRGVFGTRTCRGNGTHPPCCIIVSTLPPACGTTVPVFGCVPN